MNTFLTIYSIFVTVWLVALTVYVSRLEYERKKILELLESVMNGLDFITALQYIYNPERFEEADMTLLDGATECVKILESNIAYYRESKKEK